MIDAKELRIGNWVNIHDKPASTYHPQKITAIYSNNRVEMADSGFEIDFPFDADSLYPIPLTPELLEKAGFKVVVGQAFTAMASKQGIDLFFLYPAIDETLEVVFAFNNLQGETTRRELKYVHELQNLIFALTGQELEITL